MFKSFMTWMSCNVQLSHSTLGNVMLHVCVGVVPKLVDTAFKWRSVYFVGILPLLVLAYMRRDLKVVWDRLYQAPADQKLNISWDWRPVPDDESWEPGYVNTARDLSNALRINPTLRVFVAAGYYDLITPFFDAEYTLNRHDIQPKRVEYHYYSAGHMMYVNEPSRTQLLSDVRGFIKAQLSKE